MRAFLNFTILRAELVLARLTDGVIGVGACGGMITFAFDEDATQSVTPEPYKKIIIIIDPNTF
jgi:hypothetical protein